MPILESVKKPMCRFHIDTEFLTEFGLYETLMLSRKPQAKVFKKAVKQLLHDLRTGKLQLTRALTGDELILAAMTELQHRVSALTHGERFVH